MGMWSSPFKIENAEKLKELMSRPWILINENGLKTLPDAYDLVGSDALFDELDHCSVGDDCRYIVTRYLKKWLKEIDTFFHVDKEAVKIIKQIIKDQN
jgi:hypothetical protein